MIHLQLSTIAFLLLQGIFFLILFFFSFYAWVTVLFSQSPKPGPYVKEMNDAATFYTNRVLKDYKHRYVPSFTSRIFSGSLVRYLFLKHNAASYESLSQELH